VKPLAMLGGRMAPEPSQYTTETMALVEGLLARCAARHGVTPETARTRRTAPALAARHEWIRLLRDSWALTASETGRLCGVDHTTVLYACGRRGPR
jgi:chromosomal replication initiation ATPase DnaA